MTNYIVINLPQIKTQFKQLIGIHHTYILYRRIILYARLTIAP